MTTTNVLQPGVRFLPALLELGLVSPEWQLAVVRRTRHDGPDSLHFPLCDTATEHESENVSVSVADVADRRLDGAEVQVCSCLLDSRRVGPTGVVAFSHLPLTCSFGEMAALERVSEWTDLASSTVLPSTVERLAWSTLMALRAELAEPGRFAEAVAAGREALERFAAELFAGVDYADALAEEVRRGVVAYRDFLVAGGVRSGSVQANGFARLDEVVEASLTARGLWPADGGERRSTVGATALARALPDVWVVATSTQNLTVSPLRWARPVAGRRSGTDPRSSARIVVLVPAAVLYEMSAFQVPEVLCVDDGYTVADVEDALRLSPDDVPAGLAALAAARL